MMPYQQSAVVAAMSVLSDRCEFIAQLSAHSSVNDNLVRYRQRQYAAPIPFFETMQYSSWHRLANLWPATNNTNHLIKTTPTLGRVYTHPRPGLTLDSNSKFHHSPAGMWS